MKSNTAWFVIGIFLGAVLPGLLIMCIILTSLASIEPKTMTVEVIKEVDTGWHLPEIPNHRVEIRYRLLTKGEIEDENY